MLHTLVALALQVAPVQAPPKADSAARDSVARDSAAKAVDSTVRVKPRRLPRRIALTPELERTAFADPMARTTLHRAREARQRQDSALQSYDATTYQRFSIGLAFRKLARERLALREESAGRVWWKRGAGMRVELTGSRAVIPIAGSGGQYKADFDMTPVPYFPGRESLFPLSAFSTMRQELDDSLFIHHPLVAGSEAYYRYRTGQSMTIVLPDRSRITVRELEVTSRRPEFNSVVGSFWFDEASGQLVRAAYRLSEPLDIWDAVGDENRDRRQDLEADTALLNRDPEEWKRRIEEAKKEDEVPVVARAMFSPARVEVAAVTTEYELREGKFWMPRANYAEGHVQMGFVRSPFRLQEKYTYNSVNALDTLPRLSSLALQDTAESPENDSLPEGDLSISLGGGTPDTAAIRKAIESDTSASGRRRRARIAQRERQCAEGAYYTRMVSRYDGALRYPVSVPCDSTKLLQSADLPKSIYDEGEEVFDERQRDDLLKALDIGLQAGWHGAPVEPYWSLSLLRYNRVEGLSSAVGARWAPGGGWTVDGQARLGIADLQPNAELNLSRSNVRTTIGIGAYRRLAAANDRGDPLSFGAGLASFLYGRDEGFYYRTAGVELTGRRGRYGQLGWRLFAEDQRDAVKKTDYSLAKTFAGNDMLDNIDAREGFATGAAATLAFTKGLDPRSWRLAGDWRGEGAFGAFDYARTALDATLSRGLGRRVEAALTGAGGWSGGDLPPQRLWYLGGAQTVRGQLAGTQVGDAFWLGRLEVARSWPIMRPAVFGDVGWAGDRERMFDRPGRVMSGVGIGASFLDGLMRVDLSRGIRPRQMNRLDLYLEARF